MEGLAIRERILGQSNPELPIPIIYRGAVYADLAQFERCIALWLHALNLRKKCNTSVAKDLLRFTQVFSQILHVGYAIQFGDYIQVLRASYEEIKTLSKSTDEQKVTSKSSKCQMQNMEPGAHHNLNHQHDSVHKDCSNKEDGMESIMAIFLYLIVILTKSQICFAPEEVHEAMKIIHEVVAKAKPETTSGRTLLHFAVDSETPVDDFHTNDICKFPCSDSTKILLDAGADATAMDNERNTPLHIIV